MFPGRWGSRTVHPNWVECCPALSPGAARYRLRNILIAKLTSLSSFMTDLWEALDTVVL
jgi:hypothetical protein